MVQIAIAPGGTPEASNCNVTNPLYEAAVAHPALMTKRRNASPTSHSVSADSEFKVSYSYLLSFPYDAPVVAYSLCIAYSIPLKCIAACSYSHTAQNLSIWRWIAI